MTGLHDKRKAAGSPRVTRSSARSKPVAARRTNRAEDSALRRSKRIKESSVPRKREVSAASNARKQRPAGANLDDDGGRAYILRKQLVFVPNRDDPPPTTDEPCYMEGFPVGQTLCCAQLGLEQYNSMNQGDEHELVEALSSNAFIFNGLWVHVNFLAKGVNSCDLVPMFFAEVKMDHEGLSCVSCVKIGPGLPTESRCEVCPPLIVHPAALKC